MAASRAARVILVLATLCGMAASASATDWSPPIGIPSPSFGIFETAPASPNPWTASTPGFYYVDGSNPAATDSNNAYGTPGKPRRSIPVVLPAGAVVELHGTYDVSHSGNTIVVQGTSAKPVFIRGVSASSRPIARRGWEVKGTYAIIENIEFGPLPNQSSTGSLVILLPSSHVVLRHSDLHGTSSGGGLGIVNWEVPWGVVYTGSGVIDNVVVYDNTIHDNGDLKADFDQDAHGISVSDHVNNLWVVDNQLFRNSGDGIQINAGTTQGASAHHLYIGRNVAHHNKQDGFWVKEATDVIFSQNESYAHRPSNSSLGQCMGGQYVHDWVWFLYNHVHDCEYGITQMSDTGAFGRMFIIGNVIENIHHSRASDPSDAWGPSAIMMSGGYERHIVNNTIYNVDSGVNIATPVGTLDIADNIIANVTQARASHVILGFADLAADTTLHHDLLSDDPRLDWGNGQVHLSDSQLAAVRTLTGDPQFIDAAGGDFHIAKTSPAVNSGELNNSYAVFQQRYGLSIATDFDGNVRPDMATTDIGAYLANGTLRPTVPPPAPGPPPPGGANAPACTATSIPSAPTGLTLVSQGGGLFRAAWTKSDACGIPTTYVVEGGVAPGETSGSFELAASMTTFEAPIPAGTYYLRVKARNASGVSPASNEIEIGGVPGAPSGLKAVVSGRTLTLSWNAPTTGGTASGYIIEMGSAPGFTNPSGTFSGGITSTTSATGTVPAQTSYFRVRAVSVAGTSGPSNEVRVAAN